MKRGKWLLLILACLGLLISWVVHGLQNSLIITRDGRAILVTEVQKEKNVVLYADGAMVKTLPASDVSKIIEGSLSDPSCYYPLLSQYLRVSLANMSDFIPPGFLKKIRNHPHIDAVKQYLIPIAGACLALLLLWAGARGWRKYRRPKDIPRSPPAEKVLVRLADFSDIESLFLSIFKKKLGAPESAPSRIKKVLQPGKRPKQLLTMRVFHKNKWHIRHMTLSPIGEGSGSKSQCFYVIFDTHMVIKIPATPITDFEDYIERVQAETRIMQQLAPRICVIPNLAVLLERIHAFSDAETAPPADIENRYIRWLRKFPENQRFLSIDGSFVFFMDLARYYFLGDVTADFHSIDADLAEEIKADIDNLTNMSEFEGKYDRQGGELWPSLYKAYGSFRKALRQAVVQADTSVPISERSIKGLFLSSMAGQAPGLDDLNVSADLKHLLEKLLSQTAQSAMAAKQRYREVIVHYTTQRLFTRSRSPMGGMVTNLLELLAWTGERKVSLRDLKPDNLLVAGNPNNYPYFLTSPREYAIGLIDLETAVDFGNSQTSEILQPQLGGTPFYCTPSHFFPNALLEEIYGDLPLVLHLQDWYAMIAIIFEIVIGEKLFSETASQMPTMMKSVMQIAAQDGDLKTAFLQITRQFQGSVHRETRAKFKLHAGRLKAVSTIVDGNIQRRLQEFHQTALRAQRQRLKKLLDTHAAFKEASNRQWIENSSAADLEKLRARYQKRKGGAKLTESIRQVIRLRNDIDTLTTRIRKLTGTVPRISIDTLLEMMFALVGKKLLTDLALPAPDPAAEIPTAGGVDERALGETAEMLEYSATIQIE